VPIVVHFLLDQTENDRSETMEGEASGANRSTRRKGCNCGITLSAELSLALLGQISIRHSWALLGYRAGRHP
jgi:hypothetical protein